MTLDFFRCVNLCADLYTLFTSNEHMQVLVFFFWLIACVVRCCWCRFSCSNLTSGLWSILEYENQNMETDARANWIRWPARRKDDWLDLGKKLRTVEGNLTKALKGQECLSTACGLQSGPRSSNLKRVLWSRVAATKTQVAQGF